MVGLWVGYLVGTRFTGIVLCYSRTLAPVATGICWDCTRLKMNIILSYLNVHCMCWWHCDLPMTRNETLTLNWNDNSLLFLVISVIANGTMHFLEWQCWSNSSNAGPMYIPDPNFITTMPADALAPDGARPSAGIVLTTKLERFSSTFPRLSLFRIPVLSPDEVIQNGRRNLEKFRGTSTEALIRFETSLLHSTVRCCLFKMTAMCHRSCWQIY